MGELICIDLNQLTYRFFPALEGRLDVGLSDLTWVFSFFLFRVRGMVCFGFDLMDEFELGGYGFNLYVCMNADFLIVFFHLSGICIGKLGTNLFCLTLLFCSVSVD